MPDVENATSLLYDGVTDLTRINIQSTLGLKSRIALYFATYFPEDLNVAKEAAEEAMALRGSVVSAPAFDSSFSADEVQDNSIFELAQSGALNQGTNSIFNIYNGEFGYGDVVVHQDVHNLFSDPADVRGVEKMISEDRYGELRNKGKYTTRTSSIKLMRFEELLLNYVEAAFILNNTDARALELLNQLATERGITAYETLTLGDIRTERRKELIFEGFRFSDLMRYQEEVPESSSLDRPVLYGDYRLAFPIPQSEINVSGIAQNSGY